MHASSNKVKSVGLEVLGWVLVVVGLAAMVLPGPGLLALFAGLSILSTRYNWAERRVEPVRQAAFKAARDGVSSWPRLMMSLVAVATLVSVGVVWGLRPDTPAWWPLADKLWLIGGWGTGGTIIGSGIIAGGMLVYSFFRFRKTDS